jgi:hypothetical protein
MSFVMQAPYPAVKTTSILPSPQFADTQGLKTRIASIMRSMNNRRYTYVHKNPDETLTFQFLLTRPKALELREFILLYFAAKVKITTHSGDVWAVNFVNDPFEFTGERKAEPSREMYTINLTMRGRLLSAGPIDACGN